MVIIRKLACSPMLHANRILFLINFVVVILIKPLYCSCYDYIPAESLRNKVTLLTDLQKKVHDQARDNILTAQKRQKRQFDSKHNKLHLKVREIKTLSKNNLQVNNNYDTLNEDLCCIGW